MSVDITFGTNDKPVASKALAEAFTNCPHLSGRLFIGFPVIGTREGPRRIDALWTAPTIGFVAFDLVEGPDCSGYRERQDDFANAIESTLRSRSDLVKRTNRRRDLLVSVHTVTFVLAESLPSDVDQDFPIANAESLAAALSDLRSIAAGGEKEFLIALSALESVSTIRRTTHGQSSIRPGSRGAKLKRLEESVATLDTQQLKAMIETTTGVQRIRGLAGSGKTIVLALKAAYLHVQHPDWDIAVTFHTRALKDFFRRLINASFLSQTHEIPDWTKLRIIHAWGASGGSERDGIYHQFCNASDAPYLDYGTARRKFGSEDAFGGACELATSKARFVQELYDVILVDEAQDLPPAFLRLCYRFLKPSKRLVYAYDELQNLGDEPLPSPNEIFGKDVRRPDDATTGDIVLEKCYRNSRPVLTTAHALGFGIHRVDDSGIGTGIVQMFDASEMWHDLGYRPESGTIHDGEHVVLERLADASPKFLEEHSELDDLIQFLTFETKDEQSEWVARQIEEAVRGHDLKPEEIVVINPDPLTTPKAVGPLRALLLDKNIQNHLAGVDTGADIFRQNDSVTFTGIYRAKGNEFGMVYVINAHECYTSKYNLARARNRLFTAITRSKAWIRVCGVGENMRKLAKEHSKLKNANYRMEFVYPTERQRRHMRLVQRDRADVKRVKGHKRNLSRIIDDFESGRLYREDIADLQPKLRELLVEEGKISRADS